MTARKGSRSNKKTSTGRVTPKGTKPTAANAKGSTSGSAKARALPRPVLDQRLKRQDAKFAGHDTSRSGRRGGR